MSPHYHAMKAQVNAFAQAMATLDVDEAKPIKAWFNIYKRGERRLSTPFDTLNDRKRADWYRDFYGDRPDYTFDITRA